MSSLDLCNDCLRKHEEEYRQNPKNPLGFGGLANYGKKCGKKGVERAENFQEANKTGAEWKNK